MKGIMFVSITVKESFWLLQRTIAIHKVNICLEDAEKQLQTDSQMKQQQQQKKTKKHTKKTNDADANADVICVE